LSILSDRINQSNQGKLPDMLKLRYKLMAENAFRFYRGTCALFYEDLVRASGFPGGPPAWISGDLHLENFGAFKGGNRLVYFDLNDFDESVLAPAAWEVVRLATSIFVAFSSLGVGKDKAQLAAEHCLSTYSAILAKGKAIYIEPKTATGVVKDFLKEAARRKAKDLLKKQTNREGQRLVVEVEDARRNELDPDFKDELKAFLSQWMAQADEAPRKKAFKVRDVGVRIAGTGGVGQTRYMFLLQDRSDKDDYMLVDMKEALPSTLQPILPIAQPVWLSEAQRIVSVQQRMQNVPPAMLAAVIFKGRPYILQELQPVKDSIRFELIKDRYSDMKEVIESMAELTASAQLRSTGRQGSAIADELIAFGSRRDWQPEVLGYAESYARQVQADYHRFVNDRKDGLFKPAQA
jgi:uncharacterized protein (DUF2252 family)